MVLVNGPSEAPGPRNGVDAAAWPEHDIRNHPDRPRRQKAALGLTLTTLRCPDAAAPESRHAAGGEFTIGRGSDNDWVLLDPDRHLSKRHCVLAYRSGQWQITDVSSNGTFINHETKPIGTGAPRTLRNGDRIRTGAYEIEVTIEEEAPAFRGAQPTGRPRGPTPGLSDPFADQAKAGASWDFADDAVMRTPGAGGPAAQSVRLPADFEPLGNEDGLFEGPTHSDHAPAINDAFRPPPAAAAVIPDDWDLDLSAGAPAARPAPAVPAAVPPAPAPVAAPRPLPPAATAGDAKLLEAFLRGAGVADATLPDPLRTMEAVGASLRATVAGIRQALIARASIRGEFRIEQTMVRANGNNPLKFSADDDDALAAFLGTGRRNTMAADHAIGEALRDMRLHELATIAAMQTAIRALLMRFNPAAIEKGVDGGFAKLPGQRKARAWEAFEAMHDQVSQALSDDFDSVFGKAFARAYEQALREALDREDRR